MFFPANFLSLNSLLLYCYLWNIGENSGDNIYIWYFDLFDAYFFASKYCDMNLFYLWVFLSIFILIFFFISGGQPHTGHSTSIPSMNSIRDFMLEFFKTCLAKIDCKILFPTMTKNAIWMKYKNEYIGPYFSIGRKFSNMPYWK